MKVLALSDIHGNLNAIRRISQIKRDFELIVISGDLTHFGPAEDAEKIVEILRESGKEIIAVPGNCDPPEVMGAIERAGGINLHAGKKRIGDFTFIGFGGSNRTPFGTPMEFSEEEIRRTVSALLEWESENLVLVSHVPPKNTLDLVPPDRRIGSSALEELKEAFDVILCGHVHESRGILRNDVLIVNPGMASRGLAALIDLREKRAELFEF
ncbi:MAG: uncharacterized protein PWR13_82 [Archaeoglobi archaeon]|nr:uncharacterized protein [Archaeoglobi archaeon]MDK2781054.1 uncharacterized protein [Archaeoglobi archaeon]